MPSHAGASAAYSNIIIIINIIIIGLTCVFPKHGLDDSSQIREFGERLFYDRDALPDANPTLYSWTN